MPLACVSARRTACRGSWYHYTHARGRGIGSALLHARRTVPSSHLRLPIRLSLSLLVSLSLWSLSYTHTHTSHHVTHAMLLGPPQDLYTSSSPALHAILLPQHKRHQVHTEHQTEPSSSLAVEPRPARASKQRRDHHIKRKASAHLLLSARPRPPPPPLPRAAARATLTSCAQTERATRPRPPPRDPTRRHCRSPTRSHSSSERVCRWR